VNMEIIKIMSFAALVIGALLIIGTKFRWIILVDPPEEWTAIYSHSALKKIFGSDFLIGFNYVVGTLFIIIALFFLWKVVTGNVLFE